MLKFEPHTYTIAFGSDLPSGLNGASNFEFGVMQTLKICEIVATHPELLCQIWLSPYFFPNFNSLDWNNFWI